MQVFTEGLALRDRWHLMHLTLVEHCQRVPHREHCARRARLMRRSPPGVLCSSANCSSAGRPVGSAASTRSDAENAWSECREGNSTSLALRRKKAPA